MKKTHAINYKLFLLTVGLLYFLMEWFTSPTMGDDIVYHFQFQLDPNAAPEPINNLADLFHSQLAHYLTINGRFPVHLLAQALFAFVPDGVTDLLNALMFVLMVGLSVRIITPDGRSRVGFGMLLVFFIFVVIKGIQSAFFWQLGTFNYLWPITLNLLLYTVQAQRESHGGRWRLVWWLPLLSLLAGWSHEALSVPIAVAMAVYLWQQRKSTNRVPLAVCFGLYAIGAALCVFSPGVLTRVGDNPSLSGRLISAVVTAIFNVRVGWLLLITVLVCLRMKVLTVSGLRRNAWIVAGVLAVYGVALLSGQTVIRVAFMADCFALVVMLALWRRLLTDRTVSVCAAVAALLSLAVYVPALALCVSETRNYRFTLSQMGSPGEKIVATRSVEPHNQLEKMIISRYVQNFADYGIWGVYMPFDANDSNNRCLARMYGKRWMMLLPEDVLNQMHIDSTAYRRYGPDRDDKIYVWQLRPGQQVSEVKFLLKPEDVSQLHFWQRPVAYKGDSYVLDDFKWEVIQAFGRRYLVFCVPTTNVKRRIATIVLRP